MMKSEYEKITKIGVTQDEFDLINSMYMDSPLEKFEFCKKVANKDFVVGLRFIKIKQLEAKLVEIKTYAEAQKTAADFSYSNAGNKVMERPVKLAFPDQNTNLYAYNRRLMGLAVSIEMKQVLELIEEKK